MAPKVGIMDMLQKQWKTDPKLLNPLTLAYIGDAVLETYVRFHLIATVGGLPHYLHRLATGYVSAKAQAKVLKKLEGQLTEEEQWMVKRGRNTKSSTVPKHTNMIDYRYSTGFECMIGYLYLKGQNDRLDELIGEVFRLIETGDVHE